MRFLALLLCLIAAPAWSQNSSAPLFAAALHDADDRPFALEQLRGKPLIVNFWARWCAPCRVEIPELVKTQDKYRKRGLVVIGIGLEDKAESVRDFMKAYEMSYTVLLARDGGIELMKALGNTRAGLPFTVAIDRRGEPAGFRCRRRTCSTTVSATRPSAPPNGAGASAWCSMRSRRAMT